MMFKRRVLSTNREKAERQTMTDMCYICLLGVIILSFLPTGTTGEETHVFSCPGENVILPCNNDLSDCTSTTWIYGKYSTSVELFTEGQKRNNRERSERLSLGSHCSLNIYKTTEEDYGQYICQQYVNKQKQGNDASVYLNVLKVSLSSTQTEMRPGRSLTLSCQLFSYVSCDTLVRIEGIQLFWVNQAGVNLQTDSRYYILSSGQCIITLTTTLLNEDNNREWRCLIIKNNEIKTSDRYTVRFMDSLDTTTKTSVRYTGQTGFDWFTETGVSDHTDSSTSVIVICVVVAALTLVLAAVLCVIYKKRADKKGTHNSVVADKNDCKVTYETINISIPPTPSTNDQTDNVTYCEVTTTSKQQMKKSKVHCDDNVTYVAIKGAKSAPQDELYSSLNNIPQK